MTILHIKSRSGPDGKCHVGDLDVGVPNTEVDLTVSVPPNRSNDAEWKAEMRKLLDDLGDVHLETYPRHSLRDPWSEQ